MSDETPELFPELLTVALAAQMGPEAQALMEKMERISPDDPVLIHQRVAVLLLINRVDDAIQLAKTFYRDSKQTETSAILYTRALSSAAASPGRDKELQDVVKHFPRNLSILHLYSNYLAKSGRLAEALDHLNKAVSSVPPDAKDMLMHLAIDLPIEFHDPDLGEAELKRFRASITNPTYIIYYEGRLRHLRKDYPAATAAFNRVIDAAKEDAPGARVFAQEAMLWLRKIKYDQQKAAEMQRTRDDLESDVRPAKAAKTAPPASKETAVPEKTSAADKKKD